MTGNEVHWHVNHYEENFIATTDKPEKAGYNLFCSTCLVQFLPALHPTWIPRSDMFSWKPRWFSSISGGILASCDRKAGGSHFPQAPAAEPPSTNAWFQAFFQKSLRGLDYGPGCDSNWWRVSRRVIKHWLPDTGQSLLCANDKGIAPLTRMAWSPCSSTSYLMQDGVLQIGDVMCGLAGNLSFGADSFWEQTDDSSVVQIGSCYSQRRIPMNSSECWLSTASRHGASHWSCRSWYSLINERFRKALPGNGDPFPRSLTATLKSPCTEETPVTTRWAMEAKGMILWWWTRFYPRMSFGYAGLNLSRFCHRVEEAGAH